jgi:hypothetical protein
MSMVLDDDDAARVAIKEDGAPNTVVRPTECLISVGAKAMVPAANMVTDAAMATVVNFMIAVCDCL